MNINSQQGARGVGDDDMCVPNYEGVTAPQIACGEQRSAVKSNGLCGGLEDPDAFAALYGGSHPWFGTRDDDVGAFTAEGYGFAEDPLAQRLSNTYLRVSDRSRRHGVIHRRRPVDGLRAAPFLQRLAPRLLMPCSPRSSALRSGRSSLH
jgi:hypothetical protein